MATVGALFCLVQTASGAMRGFMSPSREMTEQDFKDLQSRGATLLRYQMRGAPCPANGQYSGAFRRDYLRWLDKKLDHLEQILAWGVKYGISVVVDNHAVPGGKYTAEESEKKIGGRGLAHYDKIFYEDDFQELFLDAWRIVALRFKGCSGIYGYDLMNEPMQFAKPTCGLYPLQGKAVQAIRAIDPGVAVIVETNVYDAPQRFRDLPFLPYTNLIYSVHMYEPMDFTHQGVLPGKPRCAYPDAAEKPFGEKCFAEKASWTKEGLRKVLSDVRRFQLAHGARIYVGEFSAVSWAEGAEVWLKDATELFAEYGWDWTYHAFREWPAWSIEHESDTWGQPGTFRKSSDNPRKRVILGALRAEEKGSAGITE